MTPLWQACLLIPPNSATTKTSPFTPVIRKEILQKLESAGVDVLFMPDAQELYGPSYETFVELERLPLPLCGKSRPVHFRGVATIVLKLFNIVLPSTAYFGSKDYQQLQVIRKMVRDLNVNVRIIGCLP